MISRIDHLVFAVPELKSGIEYIQDLLQVSVYPGGRHLTFGTHNALIRIESNTYLEIIAPDPDNPRVDDLWMGLSLVESPGKLTRWAISSPIGNAILTELNKYNPELSKISEGLRKKEDGSILKWMLTPPAPHPLIEICPFFIDWGNSIHPTSILPLECELQSLQLYSDNAIQVNRLNNALDIEIEVLQSSQSRIEAHLHSPKGEIILK